MEKVNMQMMKTRRIELRPLEWSDLKIIFSWRNLYSFRAYVMSYDDIVTYEQFCGQMRRTADTRPYRFMIYHLQRDAPIGFTYCRTHCNEDQSCFLNIYISDYKFGRGYGVDVFVLMAKFLLCTVGLKRVFMDVFSFNEMSLSAMRTGKIREIDVIRNAHTHEGKRHDVHRFELTLADMERVEEILYVLCRQY